MFGDDSRGLDSAKSSSEGALGGGLGGDGGRLGGTGAMASASPTTAPGGAEPLSSGKAAPGPMQVASLTAPPPTREAVIPGNRNLLLELLRG
jgi:hypothetical protein